ncbi:hypothetical protein [Streptomyces sp. NPDC101115]|uniref:hypothetical protein n=1 Tax=Streptomyces sp. NPDC101115 TaxID=3366106 RepID=UPI00381FD234
MAADAGDKAYDPNDRKASDFENGENQMDAMMREMAKEKGLTDAELDATPGEYEDGLQATAEQWYQYGIEDAQKKLGQP